MPATITSTPPAAVASPIAPIALNGSEIVDLAKLGSEGGDLSQFAALFQQLLGKPFPADATLPQTAILPTETSASIGGIGGEVDPAVAADTLTALMPFLEAMGFTQGLPPMPTDDSTGKLVENAEGALSADMILAAPLTPASTNAAITAADRALPRQEAQANPMLQGLATDDQGSQNIQNALAKANNGDKSGASSGREFATQLVAAIEASKEQPQQAGNTAQAVQQVISTQSPSSSSAQPASLPVSQAVGAPGWGQEVGDKVIWMANRMESRAELLLTPPQMGRVEVSLSVSGDQATASFASTNPAVREALEAALPRLREILAEAGIQLGQTQVSAENARQSAQHEKNSDNFAAGRDNLPDTASTHTTGATDAAAPAGLKIGRGLVDVFA